NARHFKPRGEQALHAAIGLQSQERDYVIQEIFRSRCAPQDTARLLESAMIDACALMVQELAPPLKDLRRFIQLSVRNANDLRDLIKIKAMVSSFGKDKADLLRLISGKTISILEQSPVAERPSFPMPPPINIGNLLVP